MTTANENAVRALLRSLGDKVDDGVRADVIEYLDEDEFSLAVNVFSAALVENDVVLTHSEREVLRDVVQRVGGAVANDPYLGTFDATTDTAVDGRPR